MNTGSSTNDVMNESLFVFGGEMVSGSGMRAVAAFVALHEPSANYDLEDPDAPYELRSAIGDLIGWEETYSGLIGGQDIPRYDDYMLLCAAYGSGWPPLALTDYMQRHGRLSRKKAEVAAQAMWKAATKRYKELREFQARYPESVKEAA